VPGVASERIGTAEIRSAFAFISVLMSDMQAPPPMAYQRGLRWRLEKPGAAGVELVRVVETLRAGMRCDISSHGPPALPCRAPLAIEGQEDLNGQVVAFDAMALAGPSSRGTGRTRVRTCAERVAAVFVQQRDECPGFRHRSARH